MDFKWIPYYLFTILCPLFIFHLVLLAEAAAVTTEVRVSVRRYKEIEPRRENENNISSPDFGKTYVGVAFSPYVKNWVWIPDKGTFTLPDWDTYSLEEVKIMLRIISAKFGNVTTYSMGVDWYNVDKPWDNTNANCLIPKAAAELNRENNNLTISIAQGVHQNDDAKVVIQEVENAFAALNYTNRVYPGTIWAMTFLNEPVNRDKGEKLLSIMQRYKDRAHAAGIKIGPRIQNCGDVMEKHGSTAETLLQIAAAVDFIMCSEFPNAAAVSQGPKVSAQILMRKVMEYSQKFKTANQHVEIILGETGWPNKGKWATGPVEKNTIENQLIYWTEIAALSNAHQIRTYLFEAFDEPWKSNHQINDPNQPDGRFGAEGHFGWWRRTNNSDIRAYVEKIYEPPDNSSLDATHGSENTSGATTGIVAAVLLLIMIPIMAILLCRLRKAQTIIERLTEADIQEFEKGIRYQELIPEHADYEEFALSLPYDRHYEIPKSKISIEKQKLLGKGEFGYVFKGSLEGVDEEVAFKTTRSAISAQQMKCLLAELKIMIYIGRHENVIRLLGAYTAEIRDGIVYIVAEYCALGSLEKHLRTYSSYGLKETAVCSASPNLIDVSSHYTHATELVDQISTIELIRWSQQIANGMEWLAGKKVIHADLATRNVLLTAQKIVKITDFGLSRRLYDYTNYVKEGQEPLPWRWMAIEALRSNNFSVMSDVWSYGITLWEIFSLGDVPYPGLSWQVDFAEDLERGLRLSCPKYATMQIYTMMAKCWSRDPNARPQFSELNNFFKELLD